jgi:hypothetical protein
MRLALKKRFLRLKRPGLDTLIPSWREEEEAVPPLSHLVPPACISFKKITY